MRLSALPIPDGRVPPELGRRLERTGLVLAAVGLAGAAGAAAIDLRRFAFAYLTGFAWLITMCVGALLFLLIQHVTKAGWSSAPRRQAEWLASALPVCALLFLPIAVLAPRLYGWLSPEAHDALVAKKVGWLNEPFFLVRAVVYLGVWSFLAWKLRATSRAQDVSARPAVETARLQRLSAPAILVTGVTLTFAAFDWLMSLDARWYSTIFGVYVFAGGFVSALALLALSTLFLEGRGLYGPVSTVEHRHDLGKLLFGFTVFWAYIAFCQYFLIWYAGIPEETIFYLRRWTGSWKAVSVTLCFAQFVIPFVLLLSRGGKRNPILLGLAAVVVLAAHYVDMFWLVMPTLDHEGARPGVIDAAALLLPVGALVAWWGRRAARDPIFPLRDPRLPEACRLENF